MCLFCHPGTASLQSLAIGNTIATGFGLKNDLMLGRNFGVVVGTDPNAKTVCATPELGSFLDQKWGHVFDTCLDFYLQGRDVRCHGKLANFHSPPSSDSLCPSASGAFAAGQKSVWKIVHLVCSVPRPILFQLCQHVPR